MSSPVDDWSNISNIDNLSDNINMDIIDNHFMGACEELILNQDGSNQLEQDIKYDIDSSQYMSPEAILVDEKGFLDDSFLDSNDMHHEQCNDVQDTEPGSYQVIDDTSNTIGAVEEVKDDNYYEEATEEYIVGGLDEDSSEIYEHIPDPTTSIGMNNINDSDIVVLDGDDEENKCKKASKKRQFAHRLQWKNENMLAAMKAVEEDNYTLRGSAKKFGVPYSSLKDRVQGRVQHGVKPGVKTILSPEEEDELENYITDIQRSGFNISNWQVRERAAEMLMLYRGAQNPYNGGIPGQNWLAGFLKRHPAVQIKKTINRDCQPSFFEQKVMFNEFFNLLSHLYKKHKYNSKPNRVYAMNDFKVSGFNEIRMIWAIAADGSYLPPFIIVRGQNVKFAAARQTYPDAYFVCTRDGLVSSETLLWWFRDHFVRKTGATYNNPCLLYMSHSIQDISFQLMQVANEQRVHIVNIPLSASSVLHPLDEQLTSLVDQIAFTKARTWKETVGTPFTYRILAQTLLSVWENDLDGEVIVHKFKTKCLYPLSKDCISESMVMGSVNYSKYDEEPCFNGEYNITMTPPPIEDPRNVDCLNSHLDRQNDILMSIAVKRETCRGDMFNNRMWSNSCVSNIKPTKKPRKSEPKRMLNFDDFHQHRQLTKAIQSIMPPVDDSSFTSNRQHTFSNIKREPTASKIINKPDSNANSIKILKANSNVNSIGHNNKTIMSSMNRYQPNRKNINIKIISNANKNAKNSTVQMMTNVKNIKVIKINRPCIKSNDIPYESPGIKNKTSPTVKN